MINAATLLNHIPRAYVLIHKNLSIELIKSHALATILGNIDPLTTTIANLLPLPPAKQAMLQPGLEQIFENILPVEMSISLLPKRVNISGKIVALTYIPLFNENKSDIEALLLEMTNVTSEETRQRLQEAKNERNEMLLKILKEKEGFLIFLKDTESDIGSLLNCDNPTVAKRILHTLKGNSSSFGLNDIAKRIHELEDEITTIKSSADVKVFASVAAHELSSLFDGFMIDNFSVLGINRQDSEVGTFQISENEINEIERQLSFVQANEVRRLIGKKLASVRTKPAHVFVATLSATVDRLAKDLGKKINFRIEGGNIRVSPIPVGTVLREIIHIIRNSCDHGIEGPEERLDKGKEAHGNIIVFIREVNEDKVEISVEDDGKGIDAERLVAAAIKKGALTEENAKKLTTKQKLELLFLDGVSTADKVSQVSGRGVGMAALKEQIAINGGSIEITTRLGEGSQFRITMPQFVAKEKNEVAKIPTFTWNETLSVGVDEMDKQHQILIKYIAGLQELDNDWRNGKLVSRDEIKALLDKVVDYTVFHFNDEEKLLSAHNYPDYATHKHLHTKLLNQVNLICEEFNSHGEKILPRITSFLANWLKGHILGTDRKYGQFINNSKISWTDDLSVGIVDMDKQHQVLIDIINQFKDVSIKAHEGELANLKPVQELATELINYTIKHFSEEEALMERFGYPDIAHHKKLHHVLVQRVKHYHNESEVDPIKVIPNMTTFLSHWLLNHINGTDKLYGAFINNKNNKAG